MGRWAKAGPVIRGLLARHARSVNSDTGTRRSFALGAFNSHTAPLSNLLSKLTLTRALELLSYFEESRHCNCFSYPPRARRVKPRA